MKEGILKTEVKLVYFSSENDINILKENGFVGEYGSPIMTHLKTRLRCSRGDLVVFDEYNTIVNIIKPHEQDKLDNIFIKKDMINNDDNSNNNNLLEIIKIHINNMESKETKEEMIKNIRTLLGNLKAGL